MRPAPIKGKTHNFGKPAEWVEDRDGPCGVLPVRVEQEGIHNVHYSNWKPSAEELRRLCNGGVVELCCVGIQPPVSVDVVPEHKE